ncbi:MAG: type VI secretion system contractile sheath domain-containing protein [Rhodothermales bacterium]
MEDEPFKGFRITSDPDTTSIEQPGKDPVRETSHLPLRLLLVSDLAPQAGDVDWDGPSRVRRVDKHSFDALMQEVAPRLAIEVPNTLSTSPTLLELDLSFPSLDAFQPAQVAAQVPSLARLLQVRVLVTEVKTGGIGPDTFRERLGETGGDPGWADQLYQTIAAPEAPASTGPAAPDQPSGGGTLDRLLGLIDLDAQPAEDPSAPAATGDTGLMGALMSAVTGDTKTTPKVEQSAADKLLADLDSGIGSQLNAIFGHADFRHLEAAWRGLKFLVDRIHFRQNIQLEVLAAGKGDLSAALYYQVLMPEHSGTLEKPPLSAAILDVAFDNSNADMALLEDLAGTGASLQAMLVASVGPAFFGVSDYSGFAKLPPLWQHFEGPEYIEWNKLRQQKSSAYLALALPAFLLRAPYGDHHPAKDVAFNEEGQLWGNAAFAVAARMAASYAETGWPTHLVGGSQRRIENLPLWKSPQGHTPLSVIIPDSKLSEFSKAGFVVVNGLVKHDAIYLARAQTVCQPEAYEDLMAATEARIHVTLACQLFVARAAHHLYAAQQALAPGMAVEQVKQAVEARLRAFFHTEGHTVPPEAVSVEVVDDSGVPDQNLLAIRLRPPSFVLDRQVSLVMGLPVPKT